MKLVATRKAEQNRMAVDPWTAVHLSSGLALGLVGVPLRRALAAAGAYEVVEQVLERQSWGQTLFVTSGPEVLVDTAAFVVGHRLGQGWNAT